MDSRLAVLVAMALGLGCLPGLGLGRADAAVWASSVPRRNGFAGSWSEPPSMAGFQPRAVDQVGLPMANAFAFTLEGQAGGERCGAGGPG